MKRCMIVDDSSVIRKVAKRILSSPAIYVIEAGSGSEALAMCSADLPNVIIVDATLPDMSGIDFIRQAMALAAPAKPHIVLCVTEFDVGTIMRAKRAGAQGYMFKPFTRPQLLEQFREIQIAA